MTACTRRLLALTVAFIVTYARLAWGQEDAQAVLNAIALQPVPDDAAVLVRALDDTDENLLIKIQFEQALEARGFILANDASLVLTFDTRGELGVWSGPDRRTMVEARGQLGSGGFAGRTPEGRNQDNSVIVNLFDSQRGGVLNRGNPRSGVSSPSRYRLAATIDDKISGRRLWQGWATADLNRGDPPVLASVMVPELVQSIGKTVREQRFDLQQSPRGVKIDSDGSP